jgi:hypothetical protein
VLLLPPFREHRKSLLSRNTVKPLSPTCAHRMVRLASETMIAMDTAGCPMRLLVVEEP